MHFNFKYGSSTFYQLILKVATTKNLENPTNSDNFFVKIFYGKKKSNKTVNYLVPENETR